LTNGRHSSLHKDVEQKGEVAKTFPRSENLYRDFILNPNIDFSARVWFVESLLESKDREIIATFLLDLKTELNEEDPMYNVVNDAVYTLMSGEIGGDWLAVD
jgi:hypothetical protein